MNNQRPSFANGSASDSVQSNNQPAGSGGVRAKAGEAVSKLAEVAQQAGTTASSLASDANQEAKGFLNQQVASGADLAGRVADSARCAADNLNQNAPQLAELVRGAAAKMEEFSQDLREQSVEDLWRTASDFTRRQPVVVFGLASLAGFLLFRMLKADSEDGYRGGEHRNRGQDFGEGLRPG
jgi:hypothetical protein